MGVGRAEPDDETLLARVREGDGKAYGAFYRRHEGAVRRYARVCAGDAHLAEDLTAEVFARTLRALRAGAGPKESARAYLLTTVRRVAAQWGAWGRREQPVADVGDLTVQQPAESAALIRAVDHSMAARAFHSLPERWQEVLWHTAVEEQPLSRVGPLLGLTPNATAVLAFRAREGLREAYLQAHVNASLTGQAGCRQHATRLGAFARRPLRRRGYRQLRHHLARCDRCRSAYLELVDINATLRGLVPAAALGWLAAARLMGGTAQAAHAAHAVHTTQAATPLGTGLAAELIPAGPGLAHAGGALARLAVGATMAIATGAAATGPSPHTAEPPPPAVAREYGAREYAGEPGAEVRDGGGAREGAGDDGGQRRPFAPVAERTPGAGGAGAPSAPQGERTERMTPRTPTPSAPSVPPRAAPGPSPTPLPAPPSTAPPSTAPPSASTVPQLPPVPPVTPAPENPPSAPVTDIPLGPVPGPDSSAVDSPGGLPGPDTEPESGPDGAPTPSPEPSPETTSAPPEDTALPGVEGGTGRPPPARDASAEGTVPAGGGNSGPPVESSGARSGS